MSLPKDIKVQTGATLLRQKIKDNPQTIFADMVSPAIEVLEAYLGVKGWPEKRYCTEHPENDMGDDCGACGYFEDRNGTIDMCRVVSLREKGGKLAELISEKEEPEKKDNIREALGLIVEIVYGHISMRSVVDEDGFNEKLSKLQRLLREGK